MALYSFTQLADSSIDCVLTKRPDLLQFVHDRGAYDAAAYGAALDFWWTHGGGQQAGRIDPGRIDPGGNSGGYDGYAATPYVSIDDFLDSLNCPVVARPAVPGAPTPQPGGDLSSLMGNQWVLLGGGALLLFLMFGRRR